MTFKRITTLILVSSLVLVTILVINQRYKEFRKNLKILNIVINFGGLILQEEYYEENGVYPMSIDNIDTRSYWEPYKGDTIDLPKNTPWVNPYYDPFAKDSILTYYPIIVNDTIIDRIIYSVGPDGKDNHKEIIENFNKGITNKIIFESGGYKPNLFNMFKSYDIIILPPSNSNRDDYFEVKWLDESYTLWGRRDR